MTGCPLEDIEAASRAYWTEERQAEFREQIRKSREEQIAKGDTMKCEECGKVVSWDEYAVNFGWCDDCMEKHLKEDGLA